MTRHCNYLPAAFPPLACAPCYAGLHRLPARLPPVLVLVRVPLQVEWVDVLTRNIKIRKWNMLALPQKKIASILLANMSIFVRRHHLFQEANSFPRAKLKEI